MRELRPSIRAKLLSLAVLPMVLAVTLVGAGLTARQTRLRTERLEERLDRVAITAAQQVRSAVAFDDRETARETLDALAHDPDVVGIQLYGARDELLHSSGVRLPRDDGSRQVHDGDRVQRSAPVDSLEGPRGTLVIAVSTANLHADRRQALLLTIAIGAGAVLLALLVTFATARGLSRRIRDVADVAIRVAGGDLAVPPLAVTSRDEVGRTAEAVNVMLVRLRELVTREANRANRLVLDHVNQGLVTVTHDGTIVGEASRATATLLGAVAAGDRLWAPLAGRTAFALEFAFAQLARQALPLDVLLDQLPASLVVNERTLALRYAPITEEHLLVTITDVTLEREEANAREAERETAALLDGLWRDRHALRRFVTDARRQIAAIETATDPAALLPPLHTLKGNAALLRLDGWVARCHAAETMLAEVGELTSEVRACFARRWRATEERLAPMLAATSSIAIPEAYFARLVATARDESSWTELRRLLHEAVLEPARMPLERLAMHCRDLAARRGCEGVEIAIVDDGVRLDPDLWSPLWSVLVHVARNAVAHGLPAARPARIELRALRQATGVVLEIADNGDGIQWEAVAARARAAGLPAESHADLVAAIFAPRLSTRDDVDELAGRGVGLAAVAETCVTLGVRYDVETRTGSGTTFRFWLPELGSERRLTCAS